VWQDSAFATEVKQLQHSISLGLESYATTQHPIYGTIYAYETDGLGHYNLMDDANVPSLLSLPYLGYCSADDPIYLNTRKFILSPHNPYYYSGSRAKGIGSPHTPDRHIWPIALIMQALTSTDQTEIEQLLTLLEQTEAGTNQMHESFYVDDPTRFTRSWFAWANSLFSELLIRRYKGDNPNL
jgi:meiotically up-regulated gene 157 (Mug157) protein